MNDHYPSNVETCDNCGLPHKTKNCPYDSSIINDRAYSGSSSMREARRQAAIRNAAMFGTDPSWYGFN